jgi:hypothetical protein
MDGAFEDMETIVSDATAPEIFVEGYRGVLIRRGIVRR